MFTQTISNCKFVAHYICVMFKVVSRINVLCRQVECKLCSTRICNYLQCRTCSSFKNMKYLKSDSFCCKTENYLLYFYFVKNVSN